MRNERNVTRATITFGLRTFGAAPLPVHVDLEYDTLDPYAVATTYHTGAGSVRWMFGRDLLADGLLAPAGEGDVRVSPAADLSMVVFELDAPDGAAVLEASAQEIAAFLNSTYDLVLAGQESSWFDFDHEMEKLAFNY